MGNDGRKSKLGAEQLERRVAPGRLGYDVPPEGDGGSDGDGSGVELAPKDQRKPRGKDRIRGSQVAR